MVNVISETIQEFNGERFYLCGFYFQHNGKRLHRTVWRYYNGEIPKGYHVHHIDGNSHNNAIDNLMLIASEEHYLKHARSESRRENGKRAIRIAIEKAPEWHHSEEGRRWHSQLAKKTWENTVPHEQTCDFCVKVYLTRGKRKTGHHFCNQNCKAKYARRHRNESDKH